VPERESAQVNVTMTFALFQPLELGEGEVVPAREGTVSSIFTMTDEVPVSPARSVALQVIVVPDVSDASVAIPQPEDEAMPDSESETAQLRVTVTLFQPFELGFGLCESTITGGVVSVP